MWTYFEGKKENIEGIKKLFKKVFNKDIDSKYLKWKNHNNPAGNSIECLAVNDKKDVVGYLCYWKSKVKLGSSEGTAFQSVDTMVHTDYRRQGIFETLSKEGLKSMVEQDGLFNYRFPNSAALKASQKLGTVKVCEIPRYIRFLDNKGANFVSKNRLIQIPVIIFAAINNLMFPTFKSKGYKGYAVKSIECFANEFNKLWEEQKQRYPIAITRNSVHLNWRYRELPGYKCYAVYKNKILKGYIILSVEEKKVNGRWLRLGHIVDIFCDEDPRALKTLIFSGVRYLKQKNSNAVSIWMLPHWFYANHLRKAGFTKIPSTSCLAVLVPSRRKNLCKTLYAPENWYVTIGDSDYV